MINVEKTGDDRFEVTVEEPDGTSRHTVTVSDNYYEKLTGGKIDKTELVRRSFEFLLKMEPKESILSSFALPVIKRYFPGYEDKVSC